jgi:hypothetical protein
MMPRLHSGRPGKPAARLLASALAATFACAPAGANMAQDDERAAEIERLVSQGQIAELSVLLRGSLRPDDLHALARAQTRSAERTQDPDARQKAFQEAEQRYQQWIAVLAQDREVDAASRTVNQARAQSELASMLLSRWATNDLDEFELTAGLRYERERLRGLLDAARELYQQAEALLVPLRQELATGTREVEERYLALGIYDAIEGVGREINYNLAWTHLYLGVIEPPGSEKRVAALRAAERRFQSLADQADNETPRRRVHLGLGMTLREQGQYAQAERYFQTAAQGAERALEAQARYEQAHNRLRAGRFEDARLTLRPLAELDPAQLAPDEGVLRFYVHLAQLWDANSYLVEAQQRLVAAQQSDSRAAVRAAAQRTREAGLVRMSRLAARGGPWPGVVRLFLVDAFDPKARPEAQSPIELLLHARQLVADQKYDEALARLNAGVARANLAAELAGDLLYELGRCHQARGELRPAADAFDRLAREHVSHLKARSAITLAYQLRAHLAEASRQAEDYARLADTLRLLVESFPEHELQRDATWWLPNALQAAGRYAEAADQFGRLARNAAQWEEAQYRRALCQRLAIDAERRGLSGAQLVERVERTVQDLLRYARDAYQRSADLAAAAAANQPATSRPDALLTPAALRKWSGLALLHAAELSVQPPLERFAEALDVLRDFEQRYPEHEALARVLGVRIAALRGARRFDEAAEVVDRYLKAVPRERAGAVLGALARDALDEIERHLDEDRPVEARKLAAATLPMFEQLERWARGSAVKGEQHDVIRYGLARTLHLAGRFEPAQRIVERLVQQDPQNGAYQRLLALVLTDALPEPAPPDALRAARRAWERLLGDDTLSERAPERYWEARVQFLTLLLRQGEAADVERAIRSERAWRPELGGPRWAARFEALYRRAQEALDARRPQ